MEFPLFKLKPKRNRFDIIQREGMTIINNLIVDNKNLAGSTLGLRRLNIPNKDLYPLREMARTIQDMAHNKNYIYIDNHGALKELTYDKFYPIISRKIKYLKRTKDGVAFIRVQSVPYFLKYHGTISEYETPWVNLVSLPRGLFIYSITERPTNRVRVKL